MIQSFFPSYIVVIAILVDFSWSRIQWLNVLTGKILPHYTIVAVATLINCFWVQIIVLLFKGLYDWGSWYLWDCLFQIVLFTLSWYLGISTAPLQQEGAILCRGFPLKEQPTPEKRMAPMDIAFWKLIKIWLFQGLWGISYGAISILDKALWLIPIKENLCSPKLNCGLLCAVWTCCFVIWLGNCWMMKHLEANTQAQRVPKTPYYDLLL